MIPYNYKILFISLFFLAFGLGFFFWKPATCPAELNLPVVVYSRGGLLYTEGGKEEKAKLEEKLINPYILYYAGNDEMKLLTMDIMVPQNVGEPYQMAAIFSNGVTEGFLFGKRGQEYSYWHPECMGPCSFSEEFKKKYPQIVNAE